MADRRRFVQVLGNLLGKAARHSPESTVVRITAVREGVHVAVSVADLRPLRAAVKNLRRKLGDAAANPNYRFNESRVGYRLG